MPEIQLVCPLEHERGVLGAPPSLAYRLWHVLAPQPHGRTLEDISDDLDGPESGGADAIQAVLQQSKYFSQLGGVPALTWL